MTKKRIGIIGAGGRGINSFGHHLLQHPDESRIMGEGAREHVRKNFLITRHLRDYLDLFNKMK